MIGSENKKRAHNTIKAIHNRKQSKEYIYLIPNFKFNRNKNSNSRKINIEIDSKYKEAKTDFEIFIFLSILLPSFF
ncbi:hypothetical protein N478_22445 [Pseudoalteromonas luteoviolacea S4060-1]|uniref:Uncharacterized protein n=1 Tax=Pseudoalteromonas luteoviolacea S4060-1 TaxID=1365257 RepID=A0A167LAS4_9GAMM|nr:hypothetical protein N478_22445 [Pseudoalteromonas luteoviolacea S4060-1]